MVYIAKANLTSIWRIFISPGLAYDVGTLQAQVQALFGLEDAPSSAGGLADRLGEIRRVVHASYVYAMRTQTLLRTALSSIRHIMALMDLIGGFVGNMSANQNLAQFDSTLSKTLTTLQVQTVAMQRAEAVEKLATPLILESLDRIQDQLMLDYPR